MIKSSQKFWVVYVRYRFIPEQFARRNEKCQIILKREIPQLREYVGDSYDFAVAVTGTEDFRSVQFCPNCHECDKYLVLKC